MVCSTSVRRNDDAQSPNARHKKKECKAFLSATSA